jgi:drug/metabolite transporter (DMT)-like permease
MEKRKATVSFVSSLCIYGTIGWALAYINLPSEIVVLFRGLLGSLFILAVLFLTKRRFDWKSVRENLKWLVLGGISLGLNWVLLFEAYRVTTVAVASLCNYMAPVIVILVAPFILKEKRSLKKAACALVAIIGMFMVSGVFEGGAEGVTLEGILLGLGAAVFAAIMVMSNKKLGPVPTFERSIMQLALSTLAALPFVVVNNIGVELSPDALSIGLVLLLGIVHTGVAYLLYFTSIKSIKVSDAALFSYIDPAGALIFSYTLLGETFTWTGFLGIVIILGASVLAQMPHRRKERRPRDKSVDI